MEDTHGVHLAITQKDFCKPVLILIIMEDTHGENKIQ